MVVDHVFKFGCVARRVRGISCCEPSFSPNYCDLTWCVTSSRRQEIRPLSSNCFVRIEHGRTFLCHVLSHRSEMGTASKFSFQVSTRRFATSQFLLFPFDHVRIDIVQISQHSRVGDFDGTGPRERICPTSL